MFCSRKIYVAKHTMELISLVLLVVSLSTEYNLTRVLSYWRKYPNQNMQWQQVFLVNCNWLCNNVMRVWLSFPHSSKASPNQNTEVTSKVAPPDEDANDGVRILTEKLSAAIATISAKEELVKQHSKVAEEAVTGEICWFIFPEYNACLCNHI